MNCRVVIPRGAIKLPGEKRICLCHGDVDAVGDDHGGGQLGDHAVFVPGHALAGEAVEGHGAELLHHLSAGVGGSHGAVHTGGHAGVIDGVDDVVAVGCELVGQEAVHLGRELTHKALGGFVSGVGIEGGHQGQALGESQVKALHGQDAVHAVTAEEGGLVADLVGVGQNLRGLGVVDGQENQVSACVLALGHLGGEIGLAVLGEGGLADDVEAQLLGLGLEAVGHACGIGVGGIIEHADLGSQILFSHQHGGVDALVGVGEAHLVDVAAGHGDIHGGAGGGQHEDLVVGSFGSHCQTAAGGDGTCVELHAPVLQTVVACHSLLAVGLVVLKLEGNLQAAPGVDLFHGDLHTHLDGHAVGGVGSGDEDVDANERSRACDYYWYLWCGPDSPLFDKSKMATFERYFIAEKATHKEEKGWYYHLRDNAEICDTLMNSFGVKGKHRHIINGHVPVRASRGENPIKADGRLMVIDGGFAKAYHNTTGIAGYTLVYHSRGFQLVQHAPFTSTEEAISNGTDIQSTTQIVEMMGHRAMVNDTDKGAELREQIADLEKLLIAYRRGLIKNE